VKGSVILTGMPGSGKSTIGKLLAFDLNVPFYDLDKIIEREEKKIVPDIFTQKGEDYFRKIENSVLLDFFEKNKNQKYVLALGGGTVCFYDCINEIKKNGTLVFLNASLDQLYQRLQFNHGSRPVLTPSYDPSFAKHLEELFEKRKRYYLQAHITVPSYDDKIHLLEEIRSRLDRQVTK